MIKSGPFSDKKKWTDVDRLVNEPLSDFLVPINIKVKMLMLSLTLLGRGGGGTLCPDRFHIAIAKIFQ